MVDKENSTLKITDSDVSAQHRMAEIPNMHHGNMMWCILHTADLGPEYWSYALLHAVYIKNILPQSQIKKTPFGENNLYKTKHYQLTHVWLENIC